VVAGWVSLFSENINGFHYTGWQCFDVSNTLICIVGSDKNIVLLTQTIITDNVSMTTFHMTTAFVIGNYKQCVLVSTVAQIKDMVDFHNNMMLLNILYVQINAWTKHPLVEKHHINVPM
jgi:hypothetical protein